MGWPKAMLASSSAIAEDLWLLLSVPAMAVFSANLAGEHKTLQSLGKSV